MKNLFLFFLILFVSCNATKWKQKYIDEKTSRIISQYAHEGNIKFATIKSKIKTGEIPQRDSMGFISMKYYPPISSLRKKEVKIKMYEMELAAALYPDSILSDNAVKDSFYMNPYKIKFLQGHKLKTDRMFFIDTSQNSILILRNK